MPEGEKRALGLVGDLDIHMASGIQEGWGKCGTTGIKKEKGRKKNKGRRRLCMTPRGGVETEMEPERGVEAWQ